MGDGMGPSRGEMAPRSAPSTDAREGGKLQVSNLPEDSVTMSKPANSTMRAG